MPAETTISCPAVPNFTQAIAIDSCNSNYILTYVDKTTPGNNPGSYSITRTWTAKDSCDNSSTASQTINEIDNTPPVIPNLVDVIGQCSATVTAPTATDSCSGIITGTTIDPLTYNNQGTFFITWTFNDGNGNSSTTIQKVNIKDTLSPVIPVLADITGNCSATAKNPTTTDNCSGVITGTTNDSLTYNTPGTHTITWTFNDGNGQSIIAKQNVIILFANNGAVIVAESCNSDSTIINLNSLLPANTPTNGTWESLNNLITLQGSNFTAKDIPLRDYIFEYKIDSGCESIKVILNVNDDCTVLPCGNIIVHNAMSVNGYEKNRLFTIDNIEDINCYPENTVEIYNRWGVLVFKTRNYNNTTNAFDGTSMGRATYNKSDGLPTGTYYYILNYTSFDNNNKIITNKKDGFLYLSR